MTSVLTSDYVEGVEAGLARLKAGLRNHLASPIGLAHDPKSAIGVTLGSTFKNSAGTTLGNAVLHFTVGALTYYVPARVVT